MIDITKTYIALALAASALTLPGCIYEYSDCPEGEVAFTIENDWRLAPDAAPEGMAYLFYRSDAPHPWRFDFPGREAGKVYLDEGRYRFVMYNDDTSHILFETLPDGVPVATTADSPLEIEGLEGFLREAPDMMWGTSIRCVVVAHGHLCYQYLAPDGSLVEKHSRKMILPTEPRQLTPVYTVRVLNTANWSGVMCCTGAVTGLASGIKLFDDKPLDTSVAFNFSPEMLPDSVLTGNFRNFGLSKQRTSSTERNEVRLYFRLSDGRNICKIFDMTEEVRTAPDPMNVTLTIDSIMLPEAPPYIKGGAFDPNVSPWKEIEVNYET